MTDLLLTAAEIEQLTGKRQRAAQIRRLRAMQIEHIARPDMCPAVSRAHVERLLGGDIGGQRQQAQNGPDWDAL